MKLTKPERVFLRIALRYYRDESCYSGLNPESTEYKTISSILAKLDKIRMIENQNNKKRDN